MHLNSAILFPAHGTAVDLRTDDLLTKNIFFNGYAYDGGGRKVVRVEVTLDEGETWLPGDVVYPRDYHPRHDCKYYVMCRWSIGISLWKLAASKRIRVRAWNQSANTQPEKHTWNILGMMNNAWYTVEIQRIGPNHIQFIHPVSMVPKDAKGWMEMQPPRVRYEEKRVPPFTFNREEVARHNSISDCWVIIEDRVFDLTDFLNMHPGGHASIAAHAGEDVTVPFYDIHSDDTHVFKAAYVIGRLAEESDDKKYGKYARHAFLGKRHPRMTPDEKEIALTPFRWVKVSLKKKEIISHDTRRFTFALESSDKRMWLPWGKHVNIGVELSDRMVVRPYTPVKPVLHEEDDGTFVLVIKIYFPTETRPGGEMTQILEKLDEGDVVKMKGPEGVLWYLGNGQFSVHGHFFYCDRLNFIVGGTGITPALAILRAIILAEQSRKTQMRLIFANKTMEDILCQKELDELLSSSEHLNVCHVIASGGESGKVGDKWEEKGRIKYISGHVSLQNLKGNVLPADSNSSCFLCGPPAMLAKAVFPALREMGFDEDQIFEF